jgi:hypothetical protein
MRSPAADLLSRTYTGWTVTAPPGRSSDGHSAAMASASSMSATSSTMKPPRISLVSTNGPSVTVTRPPRRRTVRASREPPSSSPLTMWARCFWNHAMWRATSASISAGGSCS